LQFVTFVASFLIMSVVYRRQLADSVLMWSVWSLRFIS
jgi:hypothetical protein